MGRNRILTVPVNPGLISVISPHLVAPLGELIPLTATVANQTWKCFPQGNRFCHRDATQQL